MGSVGATVTYMYLYRSRRHVLRENLNCLEVWVNVLAQSIDLNTSFSLNIFYFKEIGLSISFFNSLSLNTILTLYRVMQGYNYSTMKCNIMGFVEHSDQHYFRFWKLFIRYILKHLNYTWSLTWYVLFFWYYIQSKISHSLSHKI